MNLICIGKVVNTHALKGELRVISNFEYKDLVFKVGSMLVINGEELKIKSYRKHKNYDMFTFNGIDTYDLALAYKGMDVYIDRDLYHIKHTLNDLIGMDVYDGSKYHGRVTDILSSKLYPLLKVKNHQEYLIPYTDIFVREIDYDNKKIYINYIEGLENED